MNRRKTRRVELRGAAFLTAGRVGSGATLLNLSEGGCALEVSRSVQPGERFTLHLAIGEDTPPLVIEQARVCWSQDERIGVEFLAMSAETQEHLREWLRRRRGGRSEETAF